MTFPQNFLDSTRVPTIRFRMEHVEACEFERFDAIIWTDMRVRFQNEIWVVHNDLSGLVKHPHFGYFRLGSLGATTLVM